MGQRTGKTSNAYRYRPEFSVSKTIVPATTSFRAPALPSACHPDATAVTAELTIARRQDASKKAPLILDGDGLVLKAIAIDGAPLLPPRLSGDTLTS